jgi:hypothetical protein
MVYHESEAAKDCRSVCQQLNTQRGEREQAKVEEACQRYETYAEAAEYEEEYQYGEAYHEDDSVYDHDGEQYQQLTKSKWAEFVEHEEDDQGQDQQDDMHSGNARVVFSLPSNETNKRVKRGRGKADPEYDGEGGYEGGRGNGSLSGGQYKKARQKAYGEDGYDYDNDTNDNGGDYQVPSSYRGMAGKNTSYASRKQFQPQQQRADDTPSYQQKVFTSTGTYPPSSASLRPSPSYSIINYKTEPRLHNLDQFNVSSNIHKCI